MKDLITITVAGEPILIPAKALDADELTPNTPIQEWAGNLIRVAHNEQDAQLELCWYLAHADHYGEEAYQYLDLLPDAPGTLANKTTLGRCISKSRLRDWDERGYRRLATSSYMEFCAVPGERYEELMRYVQDEDWDREDIRNWKRQQGITTPRAPYEYQLENDQLYAENAINGREIERLQEQVDELKERAQQAESRAADYLGRRLAVENDLMVAQSQLAKVPSVCPYCGEGL